MKGKVYRRGINPSIHQARAAAKDLISSGASKHGVLLISLPRHRIGLGRRGGGGDIRDPSVEKKIRITPFFVHPLSYTIRYLSVCRQIYLNIKNVTPYTSKRVCTRGEGEKERERKLVSRLLTRTQTVRARTPWLETRWFFAMSSRLSPFVTELCGIFFENQLIVILKRGRLLWK